MKKSGINKFLGITDIPLDKSGVPQSLLNIEKKERSNPFPWDGQFSPQLVEVLLEKYASQGTIVLDPFAGSGTILYEAGRKHLQALGAEINPAAYIMAKTYCFINIEDSIRKSYIESVGSILRNTIRYKLPLIEGLNYNNEAQEIKSSLVNLHASLQHSIYKSLMETLIVRLDFFKLDLTASKVFAAWNNLKRLVMGLPYSNKPIDIMNCDSRCIPITSNIFDLVITSPPYINVHNYHQQYRASVEALGWDVLKVAKSEIGSNRKNRGNRFLTVIQYCLDIAQTMCEIKRVCKESSRVIFIVGRESRIRKIPFFNGQIVTLLGLCCAGFDIVTRQERVFKNKFGIMVYEDILHFTPTTKENKDPVFDARNIAQGVLEDAIETAMGESRDEIKLALNRIPDMQPSPLYRNTNLALG